MKVERAIRRRRSIRRYAADRVRTRDIKRILQAAIWAPSGLNNQPWAFKVIHTKGEKDGLSRFTSYGNTIKRAGVVICVFLNKKKMYNREKDTMAVGACIQNMLIRAYSLGIGSCWLGEILNRKKRVQEYLKVASHYELMAVVAFGYPATIPRGSRNKLKNFIID